MSAEIQLKPYHGALNMGNCYQNIVPPMNRCAVGNGDEEAKPTELGSRGRHLLILVSSPLTSFLPIAIDTFVGVGCY